MQNFDRNLISALTPEYVFISIANFDFSITNYIVADNLATMLSYGLSFILVFSKIIPS